MAEDFQVDPATLPENVELIEALDTQLSGEQQPSLVTAVGDMRAIVATVVREAANGVPHRIARRGGISPREEDLRGGLADGLRATDALVATEARIQLPGWTPNLGGFDVVAFGRAGEVVLIETKWADGILWQSMWDVLKLASASRLSRVTAAYAVYAAPVTHWEDRPGAELFSTGSCVSDYIITEYPTWWEKNLAGSTAYPTELPTGFSREHVVSEQLTIDAHAWEVRAVLITAQSAGKPVRLQLGRLPEEI